MYFFENILIYLALIVIIALYHHLTHKSGNKHICFLAFLLLGAFAGFSYDVGWDYMSYMDSIKIGDVERYAFIERHLAMLVKQRPQWFFIVNHFAISALVMSAIDKSSINPYISILLYICLPCSFLTSLSTIRFALASAIVFWGYCVFLRKNKIVPFLLTACIGMLTHTAILFGLILIPLHYIKSTKWLNIAILVASFILIGVGSNFQISIFQDSNGVAEINEQIEHYHDVDMGGNSMINILFLAISVVNIIFFDKLCKLDDKAPKYVLFITMGYFMSNFFMGSSVLAARFSRCLYIFSILIIPYYIKLFKNIKTQKIIQQSIIVVALVLYVYQLMIPNYNGYELERTSTYWPYRFFFNELI